MAIIAITGVTPASLPVTFAAPTVGPVFSTTQFCLINSSPSPATVTNSSNTGDIRVGTRTAIAYFLCAQASAANGCKLQVSIDGTNWYDAASATCNAGQAIVLQFPAKRAWFYYRIQHTQGATGGAVYAFLMGYDA